MENLNPIISIEDLPKIEEVEYQRLAKVYKRVRVVETFAFLMAILVGILVLWYFFPKWGIFKHRYWIGGIWLAYAIYRYISIYIQFSYTGYALRDKDIIYRTGFLVRKVKSFPLSRIQHSSVQSNFIERMFGLASVSVFTAGNASDDLVIRGIETETAEKINQWVTQKIEENDQ